MEKDTIKKNDCNNKTENSIGTAVSELSELPKDVIYIDENKTDNKSTPGDDVMLTQCILCLILVLSVFLLKFISNDFQSALLSMYTEKTNEPAQPFIAKIIEFIEAWFRR